MTAAALIPATSSAATLRERAAAAALQRVAEEREVWLRACELERESNATALAERISAVLGVSVDRETIRFDDGDDALVDVDGLLFSLGHFGDRVQLLVATTCARGCGEPLWVNIERAGDPLVRLHHVLQDSHEEHAFDCIATEPVMKAPAASPFERVGKAIASITDAGERLAQAIRAVQELEDGRSIEKSAAVRRIMQTQNEETLKVHSASSAEKIVESDGEYAAYRRRQADAEVEKQRAYAAYSAAKRTADLELELYRAWERNR